MIYVLCFPREGELAHDVAAAAAGPRVPGPRVPVPHPGPPRDPPLAPPRALQRDGRCPAHQGLPLRRQSHPQRVSEDSLSL